MQAVRLKILISLLLALTVINVGIFTVRDHFQYYPYESYSSLYSECNDDCQEKWSQLSTPFTNAELQEANDILLFNTNIGSTQTTIEKIKIIGSFIYNKFHAQFGTPSSTTMLLPPLEKFKFLSKSPTDSLWCGDFASMFLLFTRSQQILARVIEIHGLHVINEYYSPELKQWFFVDLTHNTLMAFSNKSELLNAQRFKKLINSNDTVYRFSSINGQEKITVLEKNLPFISAYFKPDAEYFYYYTTDLNWVYQFKEKVKRYFFPISWYALYKEGEKKSNIPFYVKVVFVSLEIMVLVLLILYKARRTQFKKLALEENKIGFINK